MSGELSVHERWAGAAAEGDEHTVTPLAGDVGFILAIRRGDAHVTHQVLDVPDDDELESVHRELLAALER